MTTSTKGSLQVHPYLFFDGRCDEAIEFYRRTIGLEVIALMRFKESPDPGMSPPGSGDKVMHANLRVGQTTVMASDGQCQGAAKFEGFALSLSARDAAEAERLFTALAESGQVQMPLGKTFFSPAFGMLTDRFGVCWIVVVES
jgi:PhnB protein